MNSYSELYLSHVKAIKGSGTQFTGLCPFHDDSNPSLSFNIESGFSYCHAGCGKWNGYQFAEKIGINPKPYSNGTPSGNASNHIPKTKRNGGTSQIRAPFLSKTDRKRALSYHTQLIENFDELTKGLPWTLEVVKKTFTGYDTKTERFTFLHTDTKGKAVNIKYHKTEAGEQPFSIKGHGQCRLFPLNLIKDYKDGSILIIAEGEKDVITLLSMGLNAVTSTTGADSFPNLTPLKRFKTVYILYDYDEVGRAGSVKLAKALKKQSPKSEIIVSTWKDKPEKYDLTDFFSQDNSDLLDEFYEILTGGVNIKFEIPKKIGAFTIMTDLQASKTEPKPMAWIIENILPLQFNGILAGTTGSKKSYWTMQLGMCLANGEHDFMGNKIFIPQKVLYVDTEVGADEMLRRYHRIRNKMKWKDIGNWVMMSKSGTTVEAWDSIHELIKFYNPTLLIIDSLYNSTVVNDFSKSSGMSKVTNALTEFKDTYGLTVLTVGHFNKGQNELGLDIQRMSGASQLQNWIEWCMLMTKTNVPNFNLWTVGKTRGTYHDETILGLKFNDFWFDAKGVVEKPHQYLISNQKKAKWRLVLDDLPSEFDTQQWLNVFNSKYSTMTERTGHTWLSESANSPMVIKISQGLYRKGLGLIDENNIDD
jgi:5S rRNA maturation endonuclease (ribonuclease M5)